jgi:hypothetical protein
MQPIKRLWRGLECRLSVYNKLNGLEVSTSVGLVRYAVADVTPVLEQLGGV